MRGKGNIVIIVVVSLLVVAGMSYAAKRLGYKPIGFSTAGSYEDNVLKASAGNSNAYQGYGGCNSGGCGVSAGRGGSRCGGGSGAGASLDVEQVKAGVLKYYADNYGDTDVVCEVKDYGCHMEAEILKDGNVIKRLSISGGNIREIG